MMDKLQCLLEAIRSMQKFGIEVNSVSVSAKDREHLVFLMMKNDRDVTSPSQGDVKRFYGELNLLGVRIE